MSFPLAQDVGYDPSLFTESAAGRTVLLRHVTSHGEKTIWFGFVRPLDFHAGPLSACDIAYQLKAAAVVQNLTLTLAGADGHQYSTPLPSGNGMYQVHVTGAQLGLRRSTAIQAIVIKGLLQKPPDGSQSDWLLKTFVLRAERTPEVPLSSPRLQSSTESQQVSLDVVKPGGTLEIDWQAADLPTRIAIFYPNGEFASSTEAKPGEAQARIPLPPNPAPGLWQAELSQGNARTQFRFLVLGALPPHPRLLLSAARLQELRAAPYATVRQQLHDRAAKLASSISYNPAAGENIDLMPSGPGLEPAFAGQLNPYLQLVESYADAVAYNALDYRLNQNRDALVAARRALLTMAGWPAWAPRRFRSHGMATYYEVGVVAQRVAFGYDLIADDLSPQDKQQVEQAFWKQVIAPAVQEYFVANRDPIAASNWMANSLGGALASAIAVAGDVPGWNEREAPALAQLDDSVEQLLRGLFPGDGSEVEPIGYENFAMQGISWGMSALAALHIRPQGADQMLAGFWWPYYATFAQGQQLDTGDFNGHLAQLPGFAWGAEYAGIPELRAFYRGTTIDLSKGAPVGNNGHFIEELSGPLDLVCCSSPAKPFVPPPPSRIFPVRGSAVLRSGWDADSTVISLRVGPWLNHEHHDEGSFQVAAFGQKLIDEAGYTNYYTDPHYPDYFTQAAGHNTLLVDHNPFSQSAFNGRFWPAFPHPFIRSHVLGSGFDYLNADLTLAYDGELRSYEREYFFLKPDVLVVRDRLRADQPHVFSWLLHAPNGADLTAGTAAASIRTPKATAALLALGTNTQWTTATTPLPISAWDNFDKQRIHPGRELVLNSAAVSSTQFIVAMNFAVTSTAGGVKMEALHDGSSAGVRILGDHPFSVVFRTGSGLLLTEGIAADSSALGVRSTAAPSDWFAIEARLVRQRDRILFRSAAPADLAVERRDGGLEATIHHSSDQPLELFYATAPGRVEVDGRDVPVTYRGSMVVLPKLSPGEHRVSIH